MHTKRLNDFLIEKASGDKVYFESEKLLSSLKRSGASDEIAETILTAVGMIMHDGISTKVIYNKAYEILRKQETKIAVNYRLKQAVGQLGPSGYPFEHFVGELFKARGFDVEVGKLVNGYSVRHEIDVFAKNEHKHIFVECKFHNYQGTKSDVKVPMYIRSRFDDINRARSYDHQLKNINAEGWIITNTRFTEDAEKFGSDYGLNLLAWDYPAKASLKQWIEMENLHPITCLSSITRKEKTALLNKGIVMCNDLYKKALDREILPVKPRNLRACKRELKDYVEN
ncbi:restriction endonuclease [Carboxylicivirga linearis]|uniref:Restriction endonuclease n=1 Tax=Carboxylicivirga linearis TaxID=1628157 RepID=A0ABS5JS27_9BACT|nr:restriction endonuclease [Carboxylicivirga linearis]MBS2097650.1 restriction endonuclease [Carboxylicivirga linearis]